MTEARFIALLNLYVDQELTPADAQALEEEILRNPARRRTYTQYCRMQRACVAIFESDEAPAPHLARLHEAAEAADRKILAFPETEAPRARTRRWSPVLSWGTGLAAAACLTLVVWRAPQDAAVGATPKVSEGGTPISLVPTGTVAAAAPASTPSQSDFRAVAVMPALFRGSSPTPVESMAFAADQRDTRWLSEVTLEPLQQRSLRFEFMAAPSAETRTFGGQKTYPAPQTELTAFQFQR